MYESLQALLNSPGFMPHGHCFLWTPQLLWMFVIGDSLTVAAYYSIPVALWYFARKRPDFGYNWLLVLFGVFIFACGTTHVIKLWNIWNAAYWEDGVVTVVTGVVSAIVAVAIWPAIPKLLAIPSNAQLEGALAALRENHDALLDSENQYRLLIETASEGVWILDLDGRTLFANRRMCNMLGSADLTGTSITDFAFDGDEATLRNRLDQNVTGLGRRFEFRFRRRDGADVHAIVSAQASPGRSGHDSILAVVTDITGRVHAERELEQLNRELEERVSQRTRTIAEMNESLQIGMKSQEKTAEDLRTSNAKLQHYVAALEDQSRFLNGLNSLNEMLMVCQSHREVRDCVYAFVSQHMDARGGAFYVRAAGGYERVGDGWGGHAHFVDYMSTGDCWAERTGKVHIAGGALASGLCSHYGVGSDYCVLCMPLVTRDGCIGVLSLELRAPAMPEAQGATETESLRALREQLTSALSSLEMRTRLQQLALHDPLTGAYNRIYLLEQIGREILLCERRSQTLGLAFIDLDHFKQINDKFGHAVGDKVLKYFVDTARNHIRRTDIFGRYGGEEFLLAMPDCNVESAMERIEEMRHAFAHASPAEGIPSDVLLTFTVGLVVMPSQGRSLESLLNAADKAMYRGKQARNCTVVAEMD